MPQNRNNKSKPRVMTWMKALPVLSICLIFDAVRFLFEQFWFFGPALAVVYCTNKTGEWAGSLWGLTAAACTAAGGVVGYFGVAALTAFGVVMAIAVGLFGWLTVGLILIIFNGRIFKENEGHTLWFIFSLLISETPIIGSLPGLTGITIKMYHTQIKKDKHAIKKYKEEQANIQLQERNEKITNLMQTNIAESAQAEIY